MVFLLQIKFLKAPRDSIDVVMVDMLSSSAVDCEFDSLSGKTKDYEIGNWSFSDKNAALRSKRKNRMVCNHVNVSKWSDISIRGLLFQ